MELALSDDEEKFLRAAKYGDLDMIKELITTSRGQEPSISMEKHDEIEDENGDTALLLASENGRVNVVSFLLESSSVNVNRMDEYGFTALHAASQQGHDNVMKCLIDNGVNINQQNNLGWTALHFAARRGTLSTVELLLKNGVNPLIENNNDFTAIHYVNRVHEKRKRKAIQKYIQRQQIQELIRCQYELPMGVWPHVLTRLKSVKHVYGIVCEVPHLFRQAAERASQQQKEQQQQKSERRGWKRFCSSLCRYTCQSRSTKNNMETNGIESSVPTGFYSETPNLVKTKKIHTSKRNRKRRRTRKKRKINRVSIGSMGD